MKVLIFGGKGWIGEQVCNLLNIYSDITVVHAISRADDEVNIEKEIYNVLPDRIISFIGRTSGPGFNTIDYLEQKGKLVENIKDNLYGPFVLAWLAMKHKIHFTYLGTGCIFNGGYDDGGILDNDLPNFFDSSYSTVKGYTDRIMHFFEDSVLNLRIRMPITADNHPKNFITKIRTYKKICSVSNSMTILPELLPVLIDMVRNKTTGTFNFTNPGVISHNEILELVKEIVDPALTWENFTIEEQSKILLAGRSNNHLCTDKLIKLYPNILPIKESIINVLSMIKEKEN